MIIAERKMQDFVNTVSGQFIYVALLEDDGCLLSHCHGPIFALLSTLKQKILLSLTCDPLLRSTEKLIY